MEQPPGSLDELQPQDLSTSGSPMVMDLTRKGEDCVLTGSSLDALVKSPSWYPNSETGSSDSTLQSVDPVQPDNAFSHTTVTLSYVSRSHVFPALDSLSRRSPLYGAPPKLSLHPPCDKGLALNQHYLEQVDGPVDLASDSDLCQSQDDEARLTQESQATSGNEETVSENARGNSLSPETLSSATGEDEEELAPTSEKQEVPVAVRELCSQSWEYISPLEDPVSPAATSLDHVDDVFVLPQASCSPSGDNAYLETFEEVAWDGLGTVQPVSSITNTVLDSSGENNPSDSGKAEAESLVGLTVDVPESKTFIPRVNGNTKAPRRTLKNKTPPLESGGETGLETIVINSNRYEVSGSTRTNEKTNAGTRDDGPSEGRRSTRARALYSATSPKQNAAISPNSGSDVHYDSCNHSTSHPEINNSNGTPPKTPKRYVRKKANKEPGCLSSPTCPSPSKSPKKTQVRGNTPDSKKRPRAKTKASAPPGRRQKKKPIWSPPASMFAPKEPEIRLKYVNYKEEKRTSRSDTFSPFVHVERQPSSSSLCTLVNYPDQVRTQPKKGPKAQPSGFLSAVVPSTSCLQLGRASTHGPHRRALVCCLCGLAANAMDLGDLHGPYYPEGYQPSTPRPAATSGLKEAEDDSGSDSSSSCIRGRGRKRPTLRQNGLSDGYRWTADKSWSPAAKRARLAPGSVDMEDWYSPPLLPLEPCEYWLHEDCGIWSAGVFLVNGKVYGLEEAVKAAQETVCSACGNRGATLGCFFKGCLNKFHYRCALKTDCVLIEENFSMKCKKHKNKTFKSPGTRRDDR